MNLYDLTIVNGDSYALSIALDDANGNPLNLTSYSVSGYMKAKYSDTVKLCDLGATISTPYASGIISLSIPAATTATLPNGSFPYDVEVNDGSGVIQKVLAGRAYVYPEATV